MFSFFFFIHLSFFICVYVFARARVCVLYVVPDIDIRRNIVVCCSIISAHPTLCFSCSCSLSSLYLFHVNLKNTSLSTFIIKYDNLCLHQSQAVFFLLFINPGWRFNRIIRIESLGKNVREILCLFFFRYQLFELFPLHPVSGP